jgi:hypothetical protein
MQINRINHTDNGGIDGRVGAADGGHGREAFRGEQDAVADSRAYGIEREDRIAVIGAVKLQRLDDEDFASFVRGHLLRGNQIADDAANQHAEKCSVESRP